MFNVYATLIAFTLCGGEDAGLKIANPRSTFGYLGATRQPGPRYPGETIFFTFDVVNLKLDENARASYSMTVEVQDDKKNTVFRLGPNNAIAQNFLGGNSLPCSAHFEIPYDMPAGDYLFRVTVKDRSSNQTKSLEHKAKLYDRDFALVNVGTHADREGKVPSSPIGVIGETVFVNFAALDFGRDDKTGQPSLEVTMRVLDDKGKPTFAKPLAGSVTKDVPDNVKLLPLQFALTLNRVGNFTIELEATCKVCNKKRQVNIPLKVVSLSN